MKPENHLQSTMILGRLLGTEDRATALCDRYSEVLADIGLRLAGIPVAEKHRRVYLECGNRGVGTYGNSYNGSVLWGGILKKLEAANLGEHMKTPYAPLSREFVAASDPQTIVIAGSIWKNGAESDQMRMGLTVDRETAGARLAGFAARPLWQNLTAVKTGEVYAVDHGSLRAMSDYVCTMYLAKILYPAHFGDYDPDAELARFYETYLPEIRLRGTFFLKLER